MRLLIGAASEETHERGLAGPEVKAGDVIRWLADEYTLGRGHAMAIVAVLKNRIPPGA